MKIKIKVSEATTLQIDWLVAHAQNRVVMLSDNSWSSYYSPSKNWSQSGPIIEREGISSIKQTEQKWVSEYSLGCDRPDHARAWGSTPLIAAMRCYVISKLGEEVDIPEELT